MHTLMQWSILALIVGLPMWQATPVNLAQKNLIVNPSPSKGTALEQIVEIARHNHIPLGVVVDGGEICQRDLKVKMLSNMTLDSLVQQVNGQLNEYRLTIDGGTLALRPIALRSNINKLLNLKLTDFRTDNGTMQALGINLWIWIRAVFDPKSGSVVSIISNPDSPIISGFHIPGPATVEYILNQIVKQDPGGVWILSGLTAGWETSKRDPITVTDYSEEEVQRDAVDACRAATKP
jgi:hypothetical protein